MLLLTLYLSLGDGEDEEILQEDEKKLSLSKGEKSHLIVWEVTSS